MLLRRLFAAALPPDRSRRHRVGISQHGSAGTRRSFRGAGRQQGYVRHSAVARRRSGPHGYVRHEARCAARVSRHLAADQHKRAGHRNLGTVSAASQGGRQVLDDSLAAPRQRRPLHGGHHILTSRGGPTASARWAATRRLARLPPRSADRDARDCRPTSPFRMPAALACARLLWRQLSGFAVQSVRNRRRSERGKLSAQ